jgi:uncharacterized membrane protein
LPGEFNWNRFGHGIEQLSLYNICFSCGVRSCNYQVILNLSNLSGNLFKAKPQIFSMMPVQVGKLLLKPIGKKKKKLKK